MLSMVGLVQLKLVNWLAVLLQHLLECYMSNFDNDSFTFADYMLNCHPFSAEDKFSCLFEISSLFTCVLLL